MEFSYRYIYCKHLMSGDNSGNILTLRKWRPVCFQFCTSNLTAPAWKISKLGKYWFVTVIFPKSGIFSCFETPDPSPPQPLPLHDYREVLCKCRVAWRAETCAGSACWSCCYIRYGEMHIRVSVVVSTVMSSFYRKITNYCKYSRVIYRQLVVFTVKIFGTIAAKLRTFNNVLKN